MKPLATIHVLPDLPAPLAPLWDLSYNLWWSWSTEVLELFFDIDPEVWFESGRNPLRFLASLSQDRLAAAEANGELAARKRRARRPHRQADLRVRGVRVEKDLVRREVR